MNLESNLCSYKQSKLYHWLKEAPNSLVYFVTLELANNLATFLMTLPNLSAGFPSLLLPSLYLTLMENLGDKIISGINILKLLVFYNMTYIKVRKKKLK